MKTQIMQETKKIVVSNESEINGFTRSIKRSIIRKVEKEIAKMKSMESVGSAAMTQNQELSKNPLKLWFEILTNIPGNVRKVVFEIKKTKSGFDVRIIQHGEGTNLKTINGNLLDETTVKTGLFKSKKENDSSSIYGTGIYTQSLYSSSLIYKVKTSEMDNWEVWNVKTGETSIEENTELNSGVIIETTIPYTKRMGNYSKFIEDLRDILSVYDNRNIDNGRQYILNVDGFETETKDRELSGPIQSNGVSWISKKGKSLKTAEFNCLTYEHKTYKQLVIKVPLDDTEIAITLDNIKLGKREENIGMMEGDRPYLIVYYKGSNQIAFMIPLRGHSGSTSLNNVVLECDIDKIELRPFFVTVDKFAGVNPILADTFSKILKTYLLDTYPDNKLLERAIQLWMYDVIVKDFGGRITCNNLRTTWGLSFLNDMDVETRRKVVFMEWNSDDKRHDFKIFLTDKTAKVTTDTKCVVIECKRDDFNDAARLQSIGYVVTTKNVIKIIGVSRGIKPKNVDNWNKFLTNIKGSGQLSFDLEDGLIDVAEVGFDEHYDRYTTIALEERETFN